jgi:hypothetical protein
MGSGIDGSVRLDSGFGFGCENEEMCDTESCPARILAQRWREGVPGFERKAFDCQMFEYVRNVGVTGPG